MTASDVLSWMLLIALIVGAVLLLGRTHRRADRLGWTPRDSAPHDSAPGTDDADRRRTRDELRLAAPGRLAEVVRRVAADLGAVSGSFDRARAELLEPADDQSHDQRAA